MLWNIFIWDIDCFTWGLNSCLHENILLSFGMCGFRNQHDNLIQLKTRTTTSWDFLKDDQICLINRDEHRCQTFCHFCTCSTSVFTAQKKSRKLPSYLYWTESPTQFYILQEHHCNRCQHCNIFWNTPFVIFIYTPFLK